jgi:hypothetical protein
VASPIQQPHSVWQRRGIGRDRIFAEPKLYLPIGASQAISERSKQRFGRPLHYVEKAAPRCERVAKCRLKGMAAGIVLLPFAILPCIIVRFWLRRGRSKPGIPNVLQEGSHDGHSRAFGRHCTQGS